jgi:hypothetical protein
MLIRFSEFNYNLEYTKNLCHQRKSGELDDEILKMTGKVLTENPDISTLWNIRKETILKIKETM